MLYDLGMIWGLYGILLLSLKMESAHKVRSAESMLISTESMLIKLLSLGGIIGGCFLLNHMVISVFCDIGRACGLPIPWIEAIALQISHIAYCLLPPIGYLYANQPLGLHILKNCTFVGKHFFIVTLVFLLDMLLFCCVVARHIATFSPPPIMPDLDAIAHADSLVYFLWRGVVLFAICPGIGEELLFRGILQPIILVYTKRPYLAILITSVLFAMAHLSFYHAFVVFGGSLLSGYIYHSTGNISLVMFMHFLHNSFCVCFHYYVAHFPSSDTATDDIPYIIKHTFWYICILATCLGCIAMLLSQLDKSKKLCLSEAIE